MLHIERAHRAGRIVSGPSRRPRTTLCKLRDFKQKEQILKMTRRIKPVGLYVNEDLAKETLDKREEQRLKLEDRSKEEWKSSVLCIGQVDCKGQTCLNQISLLVTLLHSSLK